jgi:ribosomal protein S2
MSQPVNIKTITDQISILKKELAQVLNDPESDITKQKMYDLTRQIEELSNQIATIKKLKLEKQLKIKALLDSVSKVT